IKGGDKTKQPTLNKARFNAALCAIVAGQREAAEKYFADIKRDADQGSELGGAELKDFFAKVGERMEKQLDREIARKEVTYETDTEEVLGYLAHGLAQWHFGKPRAAVEWLQEFAKCAPRSGLEWINSYKKIVAPYLDDVAVLRKLGELEKQPIATLEEAQKALDTAKVALSNLKTNGAFRDTLTRRVRYAQDEIARLRRVAEKTERERLDALRERELTALSELNEALPGLLRGFDYSHGAELLDGMKFETPEVQNAIVNKHYLWSKSLEFMTTLTSDIAARGYIGTLQRRSGPALQGRLTKLDYVNATISFDRGQIAIPTDTLAPETLVAIAQAISSTISDSTDYYRRQELIVVFAKMQGLDQIATTVATQLMEENRPFRQRWARFEQSGQ
ncbi:MAG: hypothetical protein ACOYMN_05285, partial [Roseimicrobium sp.]